MLFTLSERNFGGPQWVQIRIKTNQILAERSSRGLDRLHVKRIRIITKNIDVACFLYLLIPLSQFSIKIKTGLGEGSIYMDHTNKSIKFCLL